MVLVPRHPVDWPGPQVPVEAEPGPVLELELEREVEPVLEVGPELKPGPIRPPGCLPALKSVPSQPLPMGSAVWASARRPAEAEQALVVAWAAWWLFVPARLRPDSRRRACPSRRR